MDGITTKERISRLGRRDFARFTFSLLQATYGEHIKCYQGLEDHAFVRDLPEGGEGSEEYGKYIGVYLIQDVPFELFREPEAIDFRTPYLMELIVRVREDFGGKFLFPGPLPAPGSILQSVYFLNNLRGFPLDFHHQVLVPKYEAITTEAGLHLPHGVHVGNADTFVDLQPGPTIRVLQDFLPRSIAGLSIELTHDRRAVRRFLSEKYLTSGVAHVSREPYSPVYEARIGPRESVISEFEDLLSRNPREDTLEKFLSNYYREIFGWHYDRIETQIWLRFPELDINAKNRRLDLFLRNAVTADWELYELKRVVPLVSTYRDIPVLAHEVVDAIQQVRNYERILQQQFVKDAFAREGIEYFEPSLHLVAGRAPDISQKDWRWLIAHNTDRVKLLTYDDLLKEMRIRFSEASERTRAQITGG